MSKDEGECACGAVTVWACTDCRIDLKKTIYVCPTKDCRKRHESAVCSFKNRKY